MIFTHLVSSHGKQVCAMNKKDVITDTLPPNVVVIMNCTNSCINASDVIDAKLWEFASSFNVINNIKKLDNLKNLDEMNNVFIEYTQALNKGLNILEETKDTFENEYCFFFNEYPDVEFCSELKQFRSGIYTLPVTITYEIGKDNNNNNYIPSRGVLTYKDFENYENLPYNQLFKKEILQNFLLPELNKETNMYGDKNKKYKYSIESFGTSIKDTVLAKRDYSKIKLSHFIQDLNYQLGSNLFHVIILATCTVGPKDQKEMRNHFSTSATGTSFIESTTKLFQAKIAKFIIDNVNNQCEVPYNLLEFIEENDIVENDTNDEVSQTVSKQLSNSRLALRENVKKSSCACLRKNSANAETSTNTSNTKNTGTNTNTSPTKNSGTSTNTSNTKNTGTSTNTSNTKNTGTGHNTPYTSNSENTGTYPNTFYNTSIKTPYQPLKTNTGIPYIRAYFLKGISKETNKTQFKLTEDVYYEIHSYYRSVNDTVNISLLEKLNNDRLLPVIISIEEMTNKCSLDKVNNIWITKYTDSRLNKPVEFYTDEIGFLENDILYFEQVTGEILQRTTQGDISWLRPGYLGKFPIWDEETLTLTIPQQAGKKKSNKSVKPKVVINLNKKQYVVREDKGKPYVIKNKQKIYLKDLKKYKW
jgi:hypothetical protein